MSSTAMIPFDAEGRHLRGVEFRNSHGAAARVWSGAQRRIGWSGGDWVLKFDSPEGGSWLNKLAQDPEVPAEERIAIAWTFDRAFVPAADVAQVAAALRTWAGWIPPIVPALTRGDDPVRVVCHLNAIADAMELAVQGGAIWDGGRMSPNGLQELIGPSPVAAIGFHQTSVSENPWTEWDEDAEESTELGPESPGSYSIAEVLPDLTWSSTS